MKRNYLFTTWVLLLLLLVGCKDDETSYPSSSAPEIRVERNELYSVPNRKFVIKAELKDDLGLRDLKISIPEFYLDKKITFPTDELLTEYQLAYEFLAPADTKKTDQYKVLLTLTDVSGNSVSKELALYLDGDFDAPKISNLRPSDGSVILRSEDTKVDIAFDVTDVTGIDSVIVEVADLNICEKIEIGGQKQYSYSKTYSIPSDARSYELIITTLDNFVEPNRKAQKVSFSVAAELKSMYLADVSKDTDLTEDIFGVPMRYHSKKDGIFNFKYYADTDNKEIYFLGQESSFFPHCFGSVAEAGKLENSPSAEPVILPKKGYYEISVNTSNMTYTAIPYTPTSKIWNSSNITICGNGIEQAGWDPNNTDLLLSSNPDNPYQLERSLKLTGEGITITITSPNWGDPFWRLDADATVVYLGGSNYTYPGERGNYKFVMDTELERAILIKE